MPRLERQKRETEIMMHQDARATIHCRPRVLGIVINPSSFRQNDLVEFLVFCHKKWVVFVTMGS